MIPSKRRAPGGGREGGSQGGQGEGQGEDKPDIGQVQTPEVEPERKEDDMEEKVGGTGGDNRDELT